MSCLTNNLNDTLFSLQIKELMSLTQEIWTRNKVNYTILNQNLAIRLTVAKFGICKKSTAAPEDLSLQLRENKFWGIEHTTCGDISCLFGHFPKHMETGISFHRGPVWGTWRRAHLLGTLRAGWRGSGDGVLLSQEAPWRGPRGGLLYWGTQKMRFLRDMQNAL